MSNRQLEERQEREQESWVASELGISPENLSDTIWDIHEIDGNDGAVYGHRIEFEPGSNPEVLAKIDGLQDGRWVNIGFPPEEEEPEKSE